MCIFIRIYAFSLMCEGIVGLWGILTPLPIDISLSQRLLAYAIAFISFFIAISMFKSTNKIIVLLAILLSLYLWLSTPLGVVTPITIFEMIKYSSHVHLQPFLASLFLLLNAIFALMTFVCLIYQLLKIDKPNIE